MIHRICCLYTCTDNDKYLNYIPHVIENCENMAICPVILLINIQNKSKIQQVYVDAFNSICKFEFIDVPEVNDIFMAQVIRLLYPCILPQFDVVMINDIDLIMIKNDYFQECINLAKSQDKFVAGRLKNNMYFMGFNFAKPSIWTQLFNVHNIEDIHKRLITYYKSQSNGKCDWGFDQKLLKRVLSNHDIIVINKPLYNIKSSNKPRFVKIQGVFDCNLHSSFEINIERIHEFKKDIIMYTEAHGQSMNNNIMLHLKKFQMY